jgi:hypothetical protein
MKSLSAILLAPGCARIVESEVAATNDQPHSARQKFWQAARQPAGSLQLNILQTVVFSDHTHAVCKELTQTTFNAQLPMSKLQVWALASWQLEVFGVSSGFYGQATKGVR